MRTDCDIPGCACDLPCSEYRKTMEQMYGTPVSIDAEAQWYSDWVHPGTKVDRITPPSSFGTVNKGFVPDLAQDYER
jgi:hypothetical protein